MLDVLRAWIFPPECAGCGRSGAALCSGCAPAPRDAVRFSVDGVEALALAAYDGPVREAIVAMKHGQRDPIAAFAALLAPVAVQGVLVPLPTTRSRAAERGFDQSVAIVRRLAERRALPWADLLEKHGRAQAGRGRQARLQPAGRFVVKAGRTVPPRITVFDDVCTTGGTLTDALRALRTAGADVCGILVLARKSAPEPRASGAGR